ncbi:hypothetical protein B0A52_08454 [Exophiala mesophila]|uniref:Phosphoglycerate mutase n=1 Tax=Exophiala mesophila TaxID=212818 RepID=A0A438MY46_EXOME|nr:hypothetical protein B0A52_08454 [Exophiala mesophila]
MRLFLVRHGETEHNVAGLLAGVSDSRLTNHGVLQTQRLGAYLATHRNLKLTHIFASDLQRAYLTAEEVRKHQSSRWADVHRVPDVVRLALLREQDFGSLELVPWASRRAQSALTPQHHDVQDPHFRPQETKEAMTSRAEEFLINSVLPLLATVSDNSDTDLTPDCVAVVSHGLFLATLWRTILSKFRASSVRIGPEVDPVHHHKPLPYLPSWGNTCFLEVTIEARLDNRSIQGRELSPTTRDGDHPILNDRKLTIVTVNGRDHLAGLKRTRGGLGSTPHDERQKRLDGFFKRPKATADDSAP